MSLRRQRGYSTGHLTDLPRVIQEPSDAVRTRTCISHLSCSWLGMWSRCPHCQCHLAHGNLCVSSLGNLVIKDRFIRRWVHKEGFSGFKRYVTAAEDKELEAKIAVVEKYNIRIPELVERIQKCHIEDWDFAGKGTLHPLLPPGGGLHGLLLSLACAIISRDHGWLCWFLALPERRGQGRILPSVLPPGRHSGTSWSQLCCRATLDELVTPLLRFCPFTYEAQITGKSP